MASPKDISPAPPVQAARSRLGSVLETQLPWWKQRVNDLTARYAVWQDNRHGPSQAQTWLAGLAWYRLRYGVAAAAVQGLQTLAGTAGCGRVALFYQPHPFPQLFLGLPLAYGAWAKTVAADYQFSLHPAAAPHQLTALPLRPTSKCDWQRPFLAHLVGKQMFLGYLDEADPPLGYFWPGELTGQPMIDWPLPATPPLGLTTRPQLPLAPIPDELKITGKPDPYRWLLGYTADGQMTQSPGPQLNLYGSREAVTRWLEQACLAALAIGPERLVIIDGQGDLTQRLKRHALVTDLLNRKRLTAASIAEAGSGRNGFNPLAVVPGETEAQTVRRWQTWFAGMGAGESAQALLVQAYQEEIRDINRLHRWLAQPSHLRQEGNGVTHLQTALRRLLVGASVRDWLEWPTNLFAETGEKALLFTCPADHWGREQLLKGMLSGVQAVGQTRVILTGVGSWGPGMDEQGCLLVGNGPHLPGAVSVLATTPVEMVQGLLAQLWRVQGPEQELLPEMIPLLPLGAGIVLLSAKALVVRWAGGAVA